MLNEANPLLHVFWMQLGTGQPGMRQPLHWGDQEQKEQQQQCSEPEQSQHALSYAQAAARQSTQQAAEAVAK
jgi:hypothetical protein